MMNKLLMVMLFLTATSTLAQQPLLPLEVYEQRSAIAALEAELADAKDAAQDPNLSDSARRKLNQYVIELEEALAAVSNSAGAVFPNEIATIVNGTYTAAYPNVGAVLIGGETKCTGTLVGNKSVLTARHCFETSVEPRDYGVFFQHAGIRKVSSITLSNDKDVDLAMLCLEQPVAGITPSGLAEVLTLVGHPRQIVGFGVTSPGNSDSGVKRHGSVITSACSPPNVGSICWEYDPLAAILGSDRANVCSRDSGGPIGIAADANLKNEDGVISNVLPIGACAASSLATSVAVVHHSAFLDPLIRSCGSPAPSQIPDCCGPDTVVLAEEGIVPSGGLDNQIWTFSVPEHIRVVRVALSAFDVPGSNLALEVFSTSPLPGDPGCEDLGRYVSCEYRFDGGPPSNWAAKVTNSIAAGVFYQLTVTLYAHTGS